MTSTGPDGPPGQPPRSSPRPGRSLVVDLDPRSLAALGLGVIAFWELVNLARTASGPGPRPGSIAYPPASTRAR